MQKKTDQIESSLRTAFGSITKSCIMTIQTQFKVAAISKNANSFGLYGVIIIAKDGTTFQLGMSMFNRPNEGDILDCTIGATTGNLLGIPGRNYEIPQKLTDAPYTVVKALWQQKKTA